MDAFIVAMLMCPVISDTQALEIANHLSRYTYRQAICVSTQIHPILKPLPDNPSDRFIMENPSRYSFDQVLAASMRIRIRQEQANKN
jgi:hypothetical protein